MSRVVVIGSINMDIVTTTDTLPHPGETVAGHGIAFLPGGKGANQAVAAARAGAETVMVGALGDDDSARTLQRFLEQDGIDISAVKPTPGASGTALITVDSRGENTVTFVPGANDSVDSAQIRQIDFHKHDILLLQNEIPLDTVHAAITAAAEANAIVVYNSAPYHTIPTNLLPKIDYLITNELEFVQFANLPNDLVTPERLELKVNTSLSAPKNIIITIGRDGLVARLAPRVYRIHGHKVNVVDTTGAGDCFCGAFGAALASGIAPATALEFANAAAALSVQRPGGGPSMPTRSEIEAFLKDSA